MNFVDECSEIFFSEEMSFETFAQIWFHVNKKEKMTKHSNLKFHDPLNKFGRYIV